MPAPESPSSRICRSSTFGSQETKDDGANSDASSIYSQPVTNALGTAPSESDLGCQSLSAATVVTSMIDQQREGARSILKNFIRPTSSCTCSSKASIGSSKKVASMIKSSFKSNRPSKEDQQASHLQAEMNNHCEIHKLSMLKMLGFFEAMVKLAYQRPDEGTDSQRSQIKELLQEVLSAGVPVTTAEIEQCGEDILAARGSDQDTLFFRLFTNPVPGTQSQRLYERVSRVWIPQDQDRKMATRRNPQLDAGKADLARLWKFTHTAY